MGADKYIRKSFAASYKTPRAKERVRAWKKGNTVQRADKPVNPVRARELGFKAKTGYFVYRVKTKRGKRIRPKAALGRKPGKNRKRENPGKQWRWFAEQKALRKCKNAELIGSYFAGCDGTAQFFEVLLKTK